MRKTLPVVIVLLIACVCSQAQSPVVTAGTDFAAQPDPAMPALPQIGQPMGQGAAGPTPFGTGEQPVLRFAGDNAPQNQFIFSLSDDTGYDDNVFGTDSFRKRDFFTDVGPRVTFLTSRKHVTFDLDYAPFFQVYKQYSGYDSVNQSLNLDAAAQISPRFELRVRETAAEFYYGLVGGYGQPVVSGLGPPGGTVPYFVNPDTRSISSRSRVDIIFNKSARTTLDVFGDFSTLNYKNLRGTAGQLFNLEAPNGGFSYSYRVNARGTFSFTYDYGKSVYLKRLNPPRYQTQSASLSYAYQFSKTLSASFWGGPEYTQLREILLLPLPPLGFIAVPINKPEWDWSAGLSVSRTTPVSTISLMASRYVTSGGGLLTAIDDSMGELRFSRRLTLGWTGNAGLTYSQVQALSFGGLSSGRYNIALAHLGFDHKLGERASLRLNYTGTRQRHGLGTTIAGTALDYANVDRNRASVGIDWQIGKVHLGQ